MIRKPSRSHQCILRTNHVPDSRPNIEAGEVFANY